MGPKILGVFSLFSLTSPTLAYDDGYGHDCFRRRGIIFCVPN